jgi:hypothetical protein
MLPKSIMQGNCQNPRNDAILVSGFLPPKKTLPGFFCPNEIRFPVQAGINIKPPAPKVLHFPKLATFHNQSPSVSPMSRTKDNLIQ